MQSQRRARLTGSLHDDQELGQQENALSFSGTSHQLYVSSCRLSRLRISGRKRGRKIDRDNREQQA
jgi:hypothetical protein